MQLIIPEILTAAKGLSIGGAAFFMVVGLLLWANGWAWHRFWVVFGVTMTAGVLGMTMSRAAGGQQVLAAGVLTAVAAGMIALETAKLLAFATGGAVAWTACQTVFPQAQELWSAFLCGGLLGVVLYRLWTMLLASLAGSILMTHGALMLAQNIKSIDTAEWVHQHTAALNGAIVLTTLLGVILQAKLAKDLRQDERDGRQGFDEKAFNPKKKQAIKMSESEISRDHANDHRPRSRRGAWSLFTSPRVGGRVNH